MLKPLLASLALVVSSLLALTPFAFLRDPAPEVRWEGSTDLSMLQQVRADLKAAKEAGATQLNVKLISPGGPVITSLEIARLVRQASNEGLVVEIHAEALCASGCTFVLASGTPGHRFITKNALYLVHPIQSGSMFGTSCVDRSGSHPEDYDPDAVPSTSEQVRDKQPSEQPVAARPKHKTENEKVIDALYDAMVSQYAEYSGQTKETIERWMTCGRSQAGLGALAVQLRLADQVRG